MEENQKKESFRKKAELLLHHLQPAASAFALGIGASLAATLLRTLFPQIIRFTVDHALLGETEGLPAFLLNAPAGQLLVASDEGSFDAFVMNFSFSETEENKKGMDPFFAKDQNMVSAGALMMANLYLMGAEPAINELIVDAIHEHNKTALVKLPEDFAHVRLQDIEPITRLNDHTYTAGARVISDADGFIVPLYIRGYFMKKENRYRAILAVTSDAERNYLKPSLEELAKTSMKY